MFAIDLPATRNEETYMSDKPEAVISSEDIKTTLTKSEQRKKNRLDNKGQKKYDGSNEPTPGLFSRIFTFFAEARDELTKVTWPTRKETIDTTWRLLILVTLVGIYLGLVDSLLTKILSWII